MWPWQVSERPISKGFSTKQFNFTSLIHIRVKGKLRSLQKNFF